METLSQSKANFGTAPVFLTAISTILGAVMFLLFGFAVGNVGFVGTCAIILIGHMVTIPTAMAVAEIATNQKVEGGGEYYIISRSFGLNIGSAIGIALFFSQAISVAFYIMAFAEAFNPILDGIGMADLDKRVITLPALVLLTGLMLWKGADLGVKFLYAVVAILAISLVLFFLGGEEVVAVRDGVAIVGSADIPIWEKLTRTVDNPQSFFMVFAIIFPAFTGMTAGVGLSGDLKDPSKSLPRGTLYATIGGMIIYVFIALKLTLCASPESLADTESLAMQKIALWGPIIPIGLAAATISSALGSIMVAPRTLQALGGDRVLPLKFANKWLSKGSKERNEPINSSIVTSLIAGVFLGMGSITAVAEVISMFFMLTYGAICSISFMEHFAADPAYRPIFKSKWFISLTGAIMCIWLMFKMNPGYAFAALMIMVLIYLLQTRLQQDKKSVVTLFQGVIFQLSRQLHIFIQKGEKSDEAQSWRPSIICITQNTFDRYDAFEMLKWISQKYGFGTFLHLIQGYVSKETSEQASKVMGDLINLAGVSKSKVYLDTVISPSYTSAIAQALQLPGVSGKDNNMVMFEFFSKEPEELKPILENFFLVKALDFDVCILSSSTKNFGYKRDIHIWITPRDYVNASLMILLSYIILGHKEWKGGQIRIFAVYPEDGLEEQKQKLDNLVMTGRLPISAKNIELIVKHPDTDLKGIINERSHAADLTLIGFPAEGVSPEHLDIFTGYDALGNVLFVNTQKEKIIK